MWIEGITCRECIYRSRCMEASRMIICTTFVDKKKYMKDKKDGEEYGTELDQIS